ncbi:MAG: hypothetical protein CVU44_18770 [Chloroflexi bacterium HGW-Chloroflexi-6]|nr:MAG: hypothetical protein CVU44_18770 [Chloroflexi bacterium HGW-Chloroflexi-6]
MKNLIIRLSALFAIVFGIVGLYRVIVNIVYEPSALSFGIIRDTVLSFVAIYGGYQTIQLKLIGRRLLLIYFLFQSVSAALFAALILWAFIVTANLSSLSVDPSWGWPAQLRSSYILFYFSFCILSLIFLGRKNIDNNFHSENNQRHFEIIGKILAVIAPGLGRALFGKLWPGVFLFFIYFLIFIGTKMGVSGEALIISGVNLGLLTVLLMKGMLALFVWFLFSNADWGFVNNAVKSQTTPPQSDNELSLENNPAGD